MSFPVEELVTFDWFQVKEKHIAPTERWLVYEPLLRVGYTPRSSYPTQNRFYYYCLHLLLLLMLIIVAIITIVMIIDISIIIRERQDKIGWIGGREDQEFKV